MAQIINGEVVREDRACRNCLETMINPSPRKIFCSAKCGDVWWKAENRKNRVAKLYTDKPCKQCGKIIESARPNKYYCNHECSVKWHTNRKKLERALKAEKLYG